MGRYEVHRTDGNAKAIIDAMRKMGASVEVIDRPVDVIIGCWGVTALAEIKMPRGKLRASQSEFMDGWRGLCVVLRSVDDGMKLLDEMHQRAESAANVVFEAWPEDRRRAERPYRPAPRKRSA